jgi:hypothetical protein
MFHVKRLLEPDGEVGIESGVAWLKMGGLFTPQVIDLYGDVVFESHSISPLLAVLNHALRRAHELDKTMKVSVGKDADSNKDIWVSNTKKEAMALIQGLIEPVSKPLL